MPWSSWLASTLGRMRADPADRFEDPAPDQASSEMVCAVCGEPLVAVSRIETDPATGEQVEVRWAHRSITVDASASDLDADTLAGVKARLRIDPEDHPVVPVLRTETLAERLCDFCSGPAATWALPVDDFADSGRHVSHSDWAACEVCARLIRKDRWEQVTRRAVLAAAQRHHVNANDPRLIASVEDLHAKVRAHVTGDVRRRR